MALVGWLLIYAGCFWAFVQLVASGGVEPAAWWGLAPIALGILVLLM